VSNKKFLLIIPVFLFVFWTHDPLTLADHKLTILSAYFDFMPGFRIVEDTLLFSWLAGTVNVPFTMIILNALVLLLQCLIRNLRQQN
jgi:hypothetical protein